jgi:hypothetical protein
LTRKGLHAKPEVTFAGACSRIETALEGTTRREIVADVSKAKDFRHALLRLRDSMRSNVWKAGARRMSLERLVKRYDTRTRQEGFHVLHDWDGIADTVNEDIIPVDVLHYLMDRRLAEPTHTTVLAILVDYYFLHVLALLSLRVWDDGHADDNLDRLNQLLRALQGPDGSGQRFAANAETLMLIGTSHYELHERGYAVLLERVRTLNQPHRTNIAIGHAASMGSHLRFGFEATYGRDTVATRDDNVADYPWLCFALATLMSEYSRVHDEGIQGSEREILVEAMLNGLSPDARAFVGDHPPASLSACEAERSRFRERFHQYKRDLLEEFECHRPSDDTYSPLSFFFNFSHNVLKGEVVDALLRGEPWHLTLNDLLTGIPRGEPKGASKQTLAKTLMGYARANPHKIRGRLMPIIVYDPQSGRRAFAIAMSKFTSTFPAR